MNLIDTHCHIHESDFPLDRESVLAAGAAAGVAKIICVGTSRQSSREAVAFAKNFSGKSGVKIFATVGIHPHETAKLAQKDIDSLEKLVCDNSKTVVGIGEIGLDYFYEFAPRNRQIKALEAQLDLAQKFNLPISFHVRDGAKNGHSAFADLWAILANFDCDFRAVLHSYTEQNRENLKKALERNFYFGVNGIATFAKPTEQNLWRDIPLAKILLETDAPFLAPVPFRGWPNQPSLIPKIAENLAKLKHETYQNIAQTTTENAAKLFKI